MGIKVKNLGLTHYEDVWLAMKDFVVSNPEHSEIWITEHHPIYTIGLNKKGLTLPIDTSINHIFVDRGGKITYHGPGQIIIYPIINLTKYKITVKEFVSLLENSIMQFLAKLNVSSCTKKDAPGVYIGESKIASIGLRLKKHFTYHGLSMNINMDLDPFKLNSAGVWVELYAGIYARYWCMGGSGSITIAEARLRGDLTVYFESDTRIVGNLSGSIVILDIISADFSMGFDTTL